MHLTNHRHTHAAAGLWMVLGDGISGTRGTFFSEIGPDYFPFPVFGRAGTSFLPHCWTDTARAKEKRGWAKAKNKKSPELEQVRSAFQRGRKADHTLYM